MMGILGAFWWVGLLPAKGVLRPKGGVELLGRGAEQQAGVPLQQVLVQDAQGAAAGQAQGAAPGEGARGRFFVSTCFYSCSFVSGDSDSLWCLYRLVS